MDLKKSALNNQIGFVQFAPLLDFCRDSDDYSSDTASTVSDATVPAEREVVEFEVVTASSDDGDYLYLEDSSSGTDVITIILQL